MGFQRWPGPYLGNWFSACAKWSRVLAIWFGAPNTLSSLSLEQLGLYLSYLLGFSVRFYCSKDSIAKEDVKITKSIPTCSWEIWGLEERGEQLWIMELLTVKLVLQPQGPDADVPLST